MDARVTKVARVLARFSKSFVETAVPAKQEKVRSTTHRRCQRPSGLRLLLRFDRRLWTTVINGALQSDPRRQFDYQGHALAAASVQMASCAGCCTKPRS